MARTIVRLAVGAGALLLLVAAANPRSYALPDATADPLPRGAEADLVRVNCAGCHSLDYLATQPRGKPVQFWRDSVNKMVSVYGAPVDPGDAERIAAFLATTYAAAPERQPSH